MRKTLMTALALGAAAVPAIADAQVQTIPVQVPLISGTRLDVSATGEVTRVPDLAIISAGVQTLKPTATAAIEENAARMERVRQHSSTRASRTRTSRCPTSASIPNINMTRTARRG